MEHNALSRTGSADNPTRRTQQCKAAVDEILTTERTYVLRLNDVLKVSHDIALYNLLCYVKCSTSLLPFKAVAMTHCHIMFTLLVTSHVPLHLQGYRDPLNVRMHELPISVEDAKVLFAEIREIRDFNRYVCSCTISYCKNMC